MTKEIILLDNNNISKIKKYFLYPLVAYKINVIEANYEFNIIKKAVLLVLNNYDSVSLKNIQNELKLPEALIQIILYELIEERMIDNKNLSYSINEFGKHKLAGIQNLYEEKKESVWWLLYDPLNTKSYHIIPDEKYRDHIYGTKTKDKIDFTIDEGEKEESVKFINSDSNDYISDNKIINDSLWLFKKIKYEGDISGINPLDKEKCYVLLGIDIDKGTVYSSFEDLYSVDFKKGIIANKMGYLLYPKNDKSDNEAKYDEQKDKNNLENKLKELFKIKDSLRFENIETDKPLFYTMLLRCIDYVKFDKDGEIKFDDRFILSCYSCVEIYIDSFNTTYPKNNNLSVEEYVDSIKILGSHEKVAIKKILNYKNHRDSEAHGSDKEKRKEIEEQMYSDFKDFLISIGLQERSNVKTIDNDDYEFRKKARSEVEKNIKEPRKLYKHLHYMEYLYSKTDYSNSIMSGYVAVEIMLKEFFLKNYHKSGVSKKIDRTEISTLYSEYTNAKIPLTIWNTNDKEIEKACLKKSHSILGGIVMAMPICLDEGIMKDLFKVYHDFLIDMDTIKKVRGHSGQPYLMMSEQERQAIKQTIYKAIKKLSEV